MSRVFENQELEALAERASAAAAEDVLNRFYCPIVSTLSCKYAGAQKPEDEIVIYDTKVVFKWELRAPHVKGSHLQVLEAHHAMRMLADFPVVPFCLKRPLVAAYLHKKIGSRRLLPAMKSPAYANFKFAVHSIAMSKPLAEPLRTIVLKPKNGRAREVPIWARISETHSLASLPHGPEPNLLFSRATFGAQFLDCRRQNCRSRGRHSHMLLKSEPWLQLRGHLRGLRIFDQTCRLQEQTSGPNFGTAAGENVAPVAATATCCSNRSCGYSSVAICEDYASSTKLVVFKTELRGIISGLPLANMSLPWPPQLHAAQIGAVTAVPWPFVRTAHLRPNLSFSRTNFGASFLDCRRHKCSSRGRHSSMLLKSELRLQFRGHLRGLRIFDQTCRFQEQTSFQMSPGHVLAPLRPKVPWLM